MAVVPIEPIHPSEFIQDEMDARDWSRADLANAMGMDACARHLLMLDMYFIVGPQKTNMRIGDYMAERLSRAFGISAEFFLNLEARWLRDRSETLAPDREPSG